MEVNDLQSMESPGLFEADLCIVGTGAAGWAIAEQTGYSGLKVLMLESGGLAFDPELLELNQIRDVGVRLYNGRDRQLGGTTYSWAGRCVALEDIDYQARSWVPLSGWPFGPEEIAPYLDRACNQLGAGPYRSNGRASVPGVAVKPPEFDPALVRMVSWQFSQDSVNPKESKRLANEFRTLKNADLRVLTHATVTNLNAGPTNRKIESVEITDQRGRCSTVRARAFVLCAGGIENARILLYSNRTNPAGIGNEHDLVGRYLLDHPRDLEMIVRFSRRDAGRIREIFGPYKLDSHQGRHTFYDGLALSMERQRRDELLHCAAWPFEFWADDDPVEALKRLVAGPRTRLVADALSILSQPGLVADAVRERLVRGDVARHKVDRIGLLATTEQCPDPDSRVRLSSQLDRMGLPVAEVNWRIHPRERESMVALGTSIASEFKRLGLPAVELAPWLEAGRHDDVVLVDNCHPTGTTRMAADARAGVVDANCRVHGVENLYIAGSSVFPTNGHANPTLMIVAFAFRLGEHLRRVLSPRGAAHLAGNGHPRPGAVDTNGQPADSGNPMPRLRAGTKVAVTGASGFLGERLVEVLAEQDVEVTALIRRANASPRLRRTGARLLTPDLTDPDAVQTALKGIDVIFHCAYDWADASWNRRALDALIAACVRSGCRLVHISSYVVYQGIESGEMTEDLPAETSSSGYAHIKHELEDEVLRAVREQSLAATVVQPTLIYGPRSGPFTHEPAEMLRFGTVVLPNKGEGICNAVYVDDVVSAILLAGREQAALGQRFLISGPSPVTWREFYEGLAQAIGAKGPEYRTAASLARASTKPRKILRLAADPERVVRAVVQHRRLRRFVQTGVRVLPLVARQPLTDRLFSPPSRRRGQVHLPDQGRLGFLQNRSTVSSAKARTQLGYVPRFDFATGMDRTAHYLAGCWTWQTRD